MAALHGVLQVVAERAVESQLVPDQKDLSFRIHVLAAEAEGLALAQPAPVGASDHVFDVDLGSCQALVHEIRLSTAAREYDFFFITDPTTAGVVAEVLDSVTVR